MLITDDIIEEYKINGIWCNILKEPLSSYISCIVSSVKKNPLIVKYNEKETINKAILTYIKL